MTGPNLALVDHISQSGIQWFFGYGKVWQETIAKTKQGQKVLTWWTVFSQSGIQWFFGDTRTDLEVNRNFINHNERRVNFLILIIVLTHIISFSIFRSFTILRLSNFLDLAWGGVYGQRPSRNQKKDKINLHDDPYLKRNTWFLRMYWM